MLGLKLLGASAKKHVLNSCSHMGMRKEPCRYMSKGRDKCQGKRQGKRAGVLSEISQNLEQNEAKRINVYWDVENCGAALPLPCPSLVFRNMESFLRDRGVQGLIKAFSGYGNSEVPQLRNVIKEIGLCLEDDKDAVFKSILEKICSFVCFFPAPNSFFLLSANRDFARTLRKLEERGYPFIVAELTDDGELMEWPEMKKNLNREKSEPKNCEFESTPKDQLHAPSNVKNSEPNTCESTPGKAQCVTRPPRLGIFWDLEVCGVPKGVPYDAVPVNIKKFLSRREINEKISTFNAYGDVSTFPQIFVDACRKTGVSVIDGKEDSVEKAMLEDMFMFVVDNPFNSKILLISNKCFCPYLWPMRRLSTFLVAVPDLKAAEDNYFYGDIVKAVWEWPEMAMDGCRGMRAFTIQI